MANLCMRIREKRIGFTLMVYYQGKRSLAMAAMLGWRCVDKSRAMSGSELGPQAASTKAGTRTLA